MRLFGRIILVILAIVGALTLVFSGLITAAAVKGRPEPLPSQMVLQLNLDAGVIETAPDSPLGFIDHDRSYRLKDIVETVDRASRDPHVTGLVARLDTTGLGMAQVQEIRAAVQAFRKSNKRTLLYSTGLGEMGGGTVPYYLATAFQEIWLQPSGEIGLTGFYAESPFFKGTFDLLGIKPEFGARYEYKSAIDIFRETKFTKESRSSLQLLIDSWTRQTVQGIADARGLGPDKVRELIDRAPLMAEEAKDAGLVDRLAYWDEAEKSLTAGGAKLVGLNRYAKRLPAEPNAVKVALIYGVGTVQQGGGDNPLSDGNVMAAERIAKAFRDAVKNPEIKAILFRIDSPGGSYTASDTIWREVGNARTAGKPVIVSMGNVAASGGYFSAMAADRIIAQPGTITGSIGVFSGKMVLADFWKKLGVSWDEVHSGANAGIWSANAPFSPQAWDRMNAILDHIYGDFTGKAERNRNIKPDDMDKLARGRIWPGEEAKKNGLVDENGGYMEAFAMIRELARLPSQMPITLVEFPHAKSAMDYVMELFRSGHLPEELKGVFSGFATLNRLGLQLKPMTDAIESGGGQLRMPPLETK